MKVGLTVVARANNRTAYASKSYTKESLILMDAVRGLFIDGVLVGTERAGGPDAPHKVSTETGEWLQAIDYLHRSKTFGPIMAALPEGWEWTTELP